VAKPARVPDLNHGGISMKTLHTLSDHFEKMGARLKIGEVPRPGWHQRFPAYTLDVGRDKRGEFFDLKLRPGANLEIVTLDTQPKIRHLLLMIRLLKQDGGKKAIHRFLCGHDERFWFAAAVPNNGRVSTVQDAFEALKPKPVLEALAKRKVKAKLRNRRRNPAFKRQGEWFFIPFDGVVKDEYIIYRDEPLVRGDGKPHVAEELIRWGGTIVYLHYDHGRKEFSEAARDHYMKTVPGARYSDWQMWIKNPNVCVRGKIRHPDHKTLVLDGWHRVMSNTEHLSPARPNLAFLD